SYGGRGGSISMTSGSGGGWLAKRSMKANVGVGGRVVKGGGVVFGVVRSSLGEKPSGEIEVVGGESRGVEGEAI
ncbi:hypothetical protein Tco_1350939, partial [Tanacetum coccineum]